MNAADSISGKNSLGTWIIGVSGVVLFLVGSVRFVLKLMMAGMRKPGNVMRIIDCCELFTLGWIHVQPLPRNGDGE